MRDHRESSRKEIWGTIATIIGLTLLLLSLIPPVPSGATIFPFHSPDGETGDYFGTAVAVDGNYAIFGATGAGEESGGRAYICKYDGTSWQMIQELNPGTLDGGDLFGQAVDISGDYAIIGAPGDDNNGGDAGRAYIFKRDTSDQWNLLPTNVLPVSSSGGDQFGSSVTIHSISTTEAYAAVGSPFDTALTTQSGSAYFFFISNSTIFTENSRVYPSDGGTYDHFGRALSISQTSDNRIFAVIGAEGALVGNLSDAGAAYTYERTDNGWVWLTPRLVAENIEAGALFGASVSMDGNNLIIGAPSENSKEYTENSGSAYIFHWDGSAWSRMQRLTVTDGNDYDFFGVSVSISGDYAIIGADGKDPSGGAYVFWFDGTSWVLLKTIVDSDGTQLGSAVSVYSDGTNVYTVIGAPEGTTGSALIDDAAGDSSDLNFAPAISFIEDQSVLIGTSTHSIPVTITDDGTLVNAGVTWQPTGTIISDIVLSGTGDNRQIDITLNTTQSGSADITVFAEDDAGATNQMTFTITVSDPPTINGLPEEVTINENESTEKIDFTVTDDTPASELDISAASSDSLLVPSSGIALDEGDTTISITPASNQSGTATITITVEDTTNGDVSTASFLLIVNGGPSITGISPTDPSTEEDTTSVTITVTVQDDEGGSLRLTAKSQDTALVANGENDTPFFDQTETSVTAGTPVDFSFTITPVPNANGTASIVVTAIDGEGGQSSQTFDFLITPVADVPVIDDIILSTTSESLIDGINDIVSIPEDTQTPRIDIQVSHGDGKTLTVSVDSGNSSSNLNGMSTNSINVGTIPNSITTVSMILTPPADFVGTEFITVTATDETNQVSETFRLDVTEVNDRPIIHNISDGGTSIIDSTLTIDEDGQTNLLDIIVSDPEGGTLTISIDSSNTTLLPMETDGNIKLGQDGVTRNLITYDIDTVAGVQEKVNLQLAPEANLSGISLITVTVADHDVTSPLAASDSFTLEVTDQNDAPTVVITETEATVLEDGSLHINLTVNDIDGDFPLALSAESSNLDLVPNANITFSGTGSTRTMTITPAADANSDNTGGDAFITVTVSDPEAATGTDYINIIVSAVQDSPTISDIPDQSIDEGQTLNVAFEIRDPDSSDLKVTVSETGQTSLVESFNIPGAYDVFGNEYRFSVTPGLWTPLTLEVNPKPGVNGQTQIMLAVTDGISTADSDTFVLTINFVNDVPVIENISFSYEIQEDETFVLTYDDLSTALLSCDSLTQNCFNICDYDSDFLKLYLSSENSTLFPDQNIDISDGISDFGTFYIVNLKDETGCKQPNKDLELRFVPAENLSGSANITFTVEDNQGGISFHEFTIFVVSKEDAPIISGSPPLTAFVGEEYAFTPQASDPDTGDDTFLFTLERTDGGTLPDWLSFDPSTGAITGLPPLEADNTQIGLRITVTNDPVETDSQGQTLLDFLEYTLTIDKNIGLPSISPIDPQSTDEDTSLDVPFSITESNGEPVTITVQSDTPDLIPTSRITIIGEGITPITTTVENNDYLLEHDGGTTNLFIRLDPMPDANSGIQGIAQILITADDTDGPAPIETFDFTVFAQPDAPKILDVTDSFPFNLGYQIDEGTTLELSTELPVTPSDHQSTPVDFRVTDVDQDILTVTAFADDKTLIPDANIKVFERGQDPGFEPYWIVTLDNSSEALMDMTIMPAPNEFGQTIITLEVNDSDGLVTQARFLVTVGNVQDAPEIVSISVPADPILEESQTSIPFDVRDLDGDLLTISATELDESGNEVVDGLFSKISITGTGVTYDDQGDALIQVQPDTITSLNLNLTATLNRTGTADIRLTVRDESDSDQSTFSVTVFGVNDPPTIAAIPNYYINEDKSTDPPPPTPTLPVPITLDDPDGDSLEISVNSGNQDIVKDGAFFLRIGDNQFALPQTITSEQYSSASLDLTPVKFANGTVQITVTVTDGTAAPVTSTFNLTVNPVPNSPILSGIIDQTMNEDDTDPSNNPIPFTVRDPDGGTVTLFLHSDSPLIVPNDESNFFVDGPTGVVSEIINGVDPSGRNVVKVTMNLEANLEMSFGLTVLPAENMHTEGANPVNIELSVDDGDTTPAVEPFALTILPVNDAPTVSDIIGPKFTLVNTRTDPIKFTIGDIETPVQNLIVYATSSNTTLVPLGNIEKSQISDGEYNYQIVISPFGGETGTTDITVEVTDEKGFKDSTTFELIVQPENTRKALIDAIDDKYMEEDTTQSFTFDVSFPLQSGESILDVLSLTAQSDNTDLIPNGAPYMVFQHLSSSDDLAAHTYQMNITPPPDVPWKGLDDTARIIISATTNLPNSYTDQEDFIQTVIPINDTPVISGFTNGEIKDTYENVPLSFNFQVDDVDGDQLDITYASNNTDLIPFENIVIDGIDRNGKVTPDHLIGATLKITLTPSSGRTGTARIDITAKDGLTQDSGYFYISVLPSGSPDVYGVPLDMTVDKNDQNIPVYFYASDPEGGFLTITTTSNNTSLVKSTGLNLSIVSPTEKQLDTNGRVFAEAGEVFQLQLLMTPVADAFGTADIVFRAEDESGKFDTETLRLTVKAVKAGDVNDNGTVALTDAILALKVLAGIPQTDVDYRADVNNDDRIGLPEVIYILQYVAELR